MIVLIAMLVGINDIAALVALVGVNASMIGFGWMQERYEAPGAGLGPFWIGCVAGSIPWIAITIYLIGPGADQHAPGFVYGIFFSLFVLFNCFAVNQWLQYKQVGKWRDYLVGERIYITLSLDRQEPAGMADLRLHARCRAPATDRQRTSLPARTGSSCPFVPLISVPLACPS